MFESIKKRSAAVRLVEEQLYEEVVNELASGIRRNGLWAKAIAKSECQEYTAKALYIEYRVQSLLDEYEIINSGHAAHNDEQGAKDEQNEKSIWWIHFLVWSIICLPVVVGFFS